MAYLYLMIMRKIKRRPKTKPEASTLRRMVSHRELWTEIETLQHGVVRCTVPSSSVNKQSTVCEEDSYNNLTPSCWLHLSYCSPRDLPPSKSPNKNLLASSPTPISATPLSSCSHISPWMWKYVSTSQPQKGQSITTIRQMQWQDLLWWWQGVRKLRILHIPHSCHFFYTGKIFGE